MNKEIKRKPIQTVKRDDSTCDYEGFMAKSEARINALKKLLKELDKKKTCKNP